MRSYRDRIAELEAEVERLRQQRDMLREAAKYASSWMAGASYEDDKDCIEEDCIEVLHAALAVCEEKSDG
jgi:hypothetical protein